MRARDDQNAGTRISTTRIHAKEPLGWPRSELSDGRHAEDKQRCRHPPVAASWWKAAQVSVGTNCLRQEEIYVFSAPFHPLSQ